MNQTVTNTPSIGIADMSGASNSQALSGEMPAVSSDRSSTKPGNKHRGGKRVYAYEPVSLWENILYGLGVLLITMGPPFIPGVSGQTLAMIYLGAIVGFYLVICCWGMARSVRATKTGSR